jgi:transposase
MITPGPGVRIWVAAGVTDMRRGFDGLAAMVQRQLALDPFSGALFLFRGRRGHLLKILAWDGKEGAVSLTPAQLSMLTEGIDWRMPVRTWQPEMVG